MRPLPLFVALAVTAAAPPVLAQEPDAFRLLPWQGYDPAAPQDRGRGVVAFGQAPQSPGVIDTLPILALPSKGAPVRAWFLQQVPEEAFPYAIVVPASAPAPAGLTLNLVEFEYEVVGLPVDSLTADGAWARVVYAFGQDRQPQVGWVARGSDAVRLELWAHFLPARDDLFLADSVPWAFATEPLDSAVPTRTSPPPRDYVLHPLGTRGPWLRVRAVVPSDSCREPEPETETTTGWIRYLDSTGRPRVWFYPRGC